MKLAVVRVRGNVRITSKVRDTLIMLNLKKKNHAVIVEDTPHINGMLKLVKPYVTWGPADEKTAALLKNKTGLPPPRKGYGRKGVKMPFKKAGAYGDRNEKINELITRMN